VVSYLGDAKRIKIENLEILAVPALHAYTIPPGESSPYCEIIGIDAAAQVNGLAMALRALLPAIYSGDLASAVKAARICAPTVNDPVAALDGS
jgi:hypothetical protein